MILKIVKMKMIDNKVDGNENENNEDKDLK